MPSNEGNYYKFKQGENRFRILSSAITGYEYWNKDNKPIRSKEGFEGTPEDMKPDGQIKHFWAFIVWNYEAKRVQIMELTQKTIMYSIGALSDNAKWGDVKGYTGSALGQYYKMQQIEAEQKGLLDRAIAGKKPALDLSGVDTAIDSIWNPKPAQPSMQPPIQPSMEDTTQPATDLAAFLRSRGWNGRGPVPQALMNEYNASIGR